MKKLIPVFAFALLEACAPDKPKNNEEYPEQPKESPVEAVITDPTKGIGAVKKVTLKIRLRWKEFHVDLLFTK